MACCAFAIFLIFQLLAPLGIRRKAVSSAADNAPVAWQFSPSPSSATVTPPTRPSLIGQKFFGQQSKWKPIFIGLFIAELAVASITGGYYLTQQSEQSGAAATHSMSDTQWDAFVALHTTWCRAVDSATTFTIHSGD